MSESWADGFFDTLNATRKIKTEDAFNASQPCASDMHNGCDKCEPKYDFVEVPAQLVRDLIKASDVIISINHMRTGNRALCEPVNKLEALLKEQGK